MSHVHLEARLDAPADDLYVAAKDFSAYRQWMRDVRSLAVVESGPSWQVTEWEVTWLGQIYGWRERDAFDDEARTIRSTLVESRFLDQLELVCRFDSEEAGTKLTADMTFGVRFAGQVIEMLAPSLIRRNFASLSEGLRRRVSTPA